MGLFGTLAAHAANRSAVNALHALMASVGYSGLAASRRLPGLLAAIDQHAAAVRESLSTGGRELSAIGLAAYAEGVRDAAYRHGWRAPHRRVDWATDPDWVLVRLLAVCLLSHALDAD
jgi:hypothetical protein